MELIGLCCLLIASKFEETSPLLINEVLYFLNNVCGGGKIVPCFLITGHVQRGLGFPLRHSPSHWSCVDVQAFNREDVTAMELKICLELKFEIGTAYPLHFLRRMSKSADAVCNACWPCSSTSNISSYQDKVMACIFLSHCGTISGHEHNQSVINWQSPGRVCSRRMRTHWANT